MLEIIAKYWLEFALTLISTGLTFFARHYYKMYKKEKDNKFKELVDNIKIMIDENTKETKKLIEASERKMIEEDKKINNEIKEVKNEFNVLKNGVLSLHRKNFLEECRLLLYEDHKITLQEYEHLVKEWDTYHGLGGNDRGDAMFRLVELKYHN